MEGGFVFSLSAAVVPRRFCDRALRQGRPAVNAAARVSSHRTAALRCCDKTGPTDDATKILGGELDASLEDVLKKEWDQIEHFGRLGTVLDDDEDDDEVDESEVSGDRDGEEDVRQDGVHGSAGGEYAEDGVGSALDHDAPAYADDPMLLPYLPGKRGTISRSDASTATQISSRSGGGALGSENSESDPSGTDTSTQSGHPPSKSKRTRKGTQTKKLLDAGNLETSTMSQAEINAAEEWSTTPKWYFLQVKPGCEKSCAISIRNMAVALPHFRLEDVLVPSTQILRLTKGGKSVKKEERLFPGYMLICMIMDRQSYSAVASIPNVQWFMGDPNRDKNKDQPFRPPVPVSDDEMRSVYDKLKKAESAMPEVKTELRPGDIIAVTTGPHKGKEGTIVTIKPDTDEVRASLVVFGRPTIVELSFSQVRLVTSASVLNPKKKRGRKSKAELLSLEDANAAELESNSPYTEASRDADGGNSVETDDGFQGALVDERTDDLDDDGEQFTVPNKR
jgi:transcription termination/antitermination protein NusG